jgi:hypothetical protein
LTRRTVPARHWRSYGTEPLPTPAEALAEPFRAFPSWFLRVTCDRCGKDRMFSETHAAQGDMLIRDVLPLPSHRAMAAALGISASQVRPVKSATLANLRATSM